MFWGPIRRCLPSAFAAAQKQHGAEEQLGERGAKWSSELERPGRSVRVGWRETRGTEKSLGPVGKVKVGRSRRASRGEAGKNSNLHA